jgi:hypothetical protein
MLVEMTELATTNRSKRSKDYDKFCSHFVEDTKLSPDQDILRRKTSKGKSASQQALHRIVIASES